MTWLLLLLLPFACRPPAVAEPERHVLVVDQERSEVAGKGLLMTVSEGAGEPSYPTLIDSEGGIRWVRRLPGKVLRVRASTPRDGRDTVLVLLDAYDGEPGAVQRETFDGRVLSVTPAPDAHHDVLELADGRLAWLEHTEGIAPLPADPEAPISTDKVMVGPEGGEGEAVFDFFRDYPEDPWWVCDHMKKGQRIPGYYQWSHSNSLVQDPGRPDELGVMVRNFDGLMWFDLETGTFQDQLGGLRSTIDFGPEGFDHAHMSHSPSPGRYLVFDNRLHSKEASRVLEVEVDRDEGVAEIVWAWTHPEIGTVGFLGDVRRLPGGNTLIAWADEGRLTEVTPEGEVVWELLVDGVRYIGRVQLWEGQLP